MRRKITGWLSVVASIVALIGTIPLHAADDAPSWLKEIATTKLPDYSAKVAAANLWVEEGLTVVEDGRLLRTKQGATKILTSAGKSSAIALVYYNQKSSKVRELKAWMVLPNGETRRFNKDDIVDVAADRDAVFSETRVRILDGAKFAEVGAVFGFETTVEEKSVFNQDIFHFQSNLPAKMSRYSVTVPAGWKVTSKLYNHPEIKPTVEGDTYRWQLNDLKFLNDEPAMPETVALVPRLMVAFFPPEGVKADVGAYLKSWPEISQWFKGFNDPQSTVTPEVQAKANEITAGASSALEKIGKLAKFAQDVRYAQISTNLARGV
jgi:hypothetical protein